MVASYMLDNPDRRYMFTLL